MKNLGPLFVALAGAALLTACHSAPTSTASAQDKSPATPTIDAVNVTSMKLKTVVRLPAELEPFEVVAVYPKVTAFVKSISVDRGSRVRQGETIAHLEAPELVAQQSEAQAKVESARAQFASAEAKLAADQGTYERLKAAAATPGVVAGNDLVVAEKAAEADQAQMKAQQDISSAAEHALDSVREVAAYLDVKAPFDGIVTERNVHPGALVGPGGAASATSPMVRIETLSRLRLVVPVPEADAAGVAERSKVTFTVPAFPGQSFSGTIARLSHAVDLKTRTMPVELDVMNPGGRLDPGSFAEVNWPLERTYPTMFVPGSAVTSTLQRTFVVRIKDGKTDWVDVRTGVSTGKLTEVFGDLHAGDQVALRGNDEIPAGTQVSAHAVPGP